MLLAARRSHGRQRRGCSGRAGGPARGLVGALLVFVNVAPNTWQIRLRPRVWHGAFVGVAAAAAIMTISQPDPFIYFQFLAQRSVCGG
jgi:hypothetical protein